MSYYSTKTRRRGFKKLATGAVNTGTQFTTLPGGSIQRRGFVLVSVASHHSF